MLDKKKIEKLNKMGCREDSSGRFYRDLSDLMMEIENKCSNCSKHCEKYLG